MVFLLLNVAGASCKRKDMIRESQQDRVSKAIGGGQPSSWRLARTRVGLRHGGPVPEVERGWRVVASRGRDEPIGEPAPAPERRRGAELQHEGQGPGAEADDQPAPAMYVE
jgi:hypothetical protein